MIQTHHVVIASLSSLVALVAACSSDNHPNFSNADAADAGASGGAGGSSGTSAGGTQPTGGSPGTGGSIETGGGKSSGGGAPPTGGGSGNGGSAGFDSGSSGGRGPDASASNGGSSSGGRGPDASASGSGGSGPDGGLGSGGAANTGGAGGSVPDGSSTNRDAAADEGLLLVTGTDFFTTTELVALDRASHRVDARTTFADGDVVAHVSAGRGFVLERTLGAVDVLSETGTVERRVTFPNSDGGSPLVDPTDVVVVPGASGPKAYVPFYDSSAIGVVDVTTGAILGVIDLSGFQDSRDTDGSVEVNLGFYDPKTARAYFTLERIDRTTITAATNYELVCRPAPSLFVAVDPASDSIVPIGGASGAGDTGTSGKPAVSLRFVDPNDLAFDAAHGHALVVSSGCVPNADAGLTLEENGIEAVDLATGVSSALYSPSSGKYLGGIVLFDGGSALVQSYDAFFDTLWNTWNPSSPELGSSLANVPNAVAPDRDGALVGASYGSLGDGGMGTTVYDYTVAGDSARAVEEITWSNSAIYAVGNVALVR